MARPVNSTRPMGSSATTTITLEDLPQQPQSLVLRLSRQPSAKKKVSWKEGTVDNEFLQRKSSKKCCVFHKQKPFDEDDSDDDDKDNHNHKHEDGKSRNDDSHGNCSGGCSNDAETSRGCSHSGAE